MTALHKRGTGKKAIAMHYGKEFLVLIKDWYSQYLSSVEITEKIKNDTGISITPRFIQICLKEAGLTRSQSDSFLLAIKKGRKTYASLRRSIKSSASRKGISLKLRYEILMRDKSRCVICGISSQDEGLVIDHIIPVVKGGSNDLANLRTLCRPRNHGEMISEERNI